MTSTLHRLGGLAAVIIGLAVGWFFLWQPLQAAYAGAPSVSYQLRAFFFVPLCIVFGLAFLLRGNQLDYRQDDGKNLTPTGWTLFAIITVLTAAGFFWFKQEFGALGYQ